MTESLATIFPAAFPALALAHFAALLSPGPDFFLIVGHGARHRFKGSAFICLGIALGNLLYIVLAIVGWAGLRGWPGLFRLLEIAGGVYLAWMGLMLWRSGQTGGPMANRFEAPPLSAGAQLAAGLGSALLNPKNIVFYLTLMTVIVGADATIIQQAASGLWMFLVVLLWDLGLAAILSLPGPQRLLRPKIPLVEKAAGLTLMMLAVGLLLGPLFQRAWLAW